MSDAGRLVLPFGIAAGGRQIGWSIRPKGAGIAHCLVHGLSGSGKTECLLTLAGQALDRDHLVYVVDPKADDFEEWADQKICPVATDPGSIAAMVAKIRRERERRVRDIRKTRRMALLASGHMPSILLVVDEMKALLDMVGWTRTKSVPVMDDLLNLAQQGRSAGIHLLVATQYPTVDSVGGGGFRNQLELTIALGALKTEARSLTGITASLTGDVPRGRGIVAWPGTEIEVQVGLSAPRNLESGSLNPSLGARGRLFEPANGADCPVGGGYEQPANRGLLPPLTEDVVARIVALRGDGWPLRRIAAEVGCSVAAVHKYASRQVVE